VDKWNKYLLVFLLLSNSSLLWASDVLVKKISGQATVSGKVLKESDKILFGSIIELKNKKDYIDFEYDNGTVIRIQGGKAKINPLNKGNFKIQLLVGKLFAYVKKLSNNRTFSVKTRVAAYGVRGTKFMVEVANDKDYLCVCEGVVEAKKNSSEKGKHMKVVSVKVHEDLWIKTNSESYSPSKASSDMLGMAGESFKEMGFPVEW